MTDADVEDVVSFLRNEIETHYGLGSVGIDIASFAGRSVAWWRSGGSQSTA